MPNTHYAAIVDGLHERFATVASLGAQRVLDYEPTALGDPPVLYSLFDSFRREQRGQVTVMVYRTMHRLLLRWQDNQQAETELLPYVNSLAAAVDADPQLGGRVVSGIAKITDASAGFVTVGGTEYRALDVFSEAIEKASYKSGI